MPVLLNAIVWLIILRMVVQRRSAPRARRLGAALVAVALLPPGIWQATVYVSGKLHWLSGLAQAPLSRCEWAQLSA